MQRTVVISGPTASGKSALALAVAEAIGGEIVSVDSMQLYRGIPIGTAQPTAEEMRRIPHHLVGIHDFSVKADVYDFIRLAEDAISEIRSRGKVPVLAGGTGFYLKALLYGLDDLPGDETLRDQLNEQYDRDDAFDDLRLRMQRLDPAAAAKWHDCRRKLIRALEVHLLTGRSILELQQGERKLRFPVQAFTLEWSPEALRERIGRRCRIMLENGWIDEAREAIAGGLLTSPTAYQALGYSWIGEYLANRLSRPDLERIIVEKTAQFARRQRTWFRHQHPESMPIPGSVTAEEVLRHIAGGEAR
ncbi:MAG: tRNA (adenosine(37)-N6)-dimethylallyltransferase MiaA [Lentisphaeria bacterium]|nr:tRNA (adenosine(37)-N6)-dimethylallyltransferase MiaA [Lentisphaeria bacterium]